MRARLVTSVIAAVAAAVVVPALVLVGASSATAGASTGNCSDLDSGRVVVPGNAQSTTATAPAGKLIVSYCVKAAGRPGTTGAPYYVTLPQGLSSVVLSHPDGGNLTHYSLGYVPVPTSTPSTPSTPESPFDWNWQYGAPACDAVSVTYPANIPSGQANDANVRLMTNRGEITLNFHNNAGTWSGTHRFVYADNPGWPAGITSWHVTWVQVGGTNYHWQGDVACPVVVDEPAGPPPFDWNWEYPAPTCTALTVTYPSNIPSGQANDVNVRVETNLGQVTLNFHNNLTTWSGTTGFTYSQHPGWPAGVTSYHVVWVQVGGTNYHWQGDVACRTDGDSSTVDVPQAVTTVTGFRSGTLTVARGRSVAADPVDVSAPGTGGVTLERYVAGRWTALKALSTDVDGDALVTYPRFTKRGTYRYRVAVTGTESVTGATTRALTVRVR